MLWKVPEKDKANWHLAFIRRKARLIRLLELRAPDIVIANECQLVAEAANGGRWGLIRNIFKDRIDYRRFSLRLWYWRNVLGMSDKQIEARLTPPSTEEQKKAS